MSVLGPVFRSQFHFPSDKVGLCILIEMRNGSGRVDLGHVLTNISDHFSSLFWTPVKCMRLVGDIEEWQWFNRPPPPVYMGSSPLP